MNRIIVDYQSSLASLLKTCSAMRRSRFSTLVADLFTYLRLPLTPLAKERKQDSRVLSLLGARDDIARRMTSEKKVDSTNLAILVDLDQSLLSHASLITKCVNRLAFQN
ncbi:MAG: hypothetical protein QOK48_263, partial [Blastocatellia bacterium]|nr:hypothetical protein [Blastocatellia bacterium]